ncbi:MAG: dTDP-4-dehydrorhamnose 3,5-epimerase [Proteobacteria bacterium]|nr:MAG: dTDP-4-dehydrorhamnose 3,5-epimerase [Pseudomonadota bacterium]PIE39875.1 MAG: dTDP-4-dehydrorhamnose 3,5-epimerase [Gammaproteobacteria bacterium]
MKVLKTKIEGVLVVEPRVFGDERGYFVETWQAKRYRAAGICADFVQDNHSRSAHGVLRGLHFQVSRPQGKLVRVTCGEVYDVALDIRPDSPTFGQWVGVLLSGKNHCQLYVPPGCAHGFCVTSESADFLYKCTDYYDPADEAGIIWNDPELAIEWPIAAPVLSEKDTHWPTFSRFRKQLGQKT